ncbi:glutamyl-tRNA(Gln) amidotransferase subunit HER2 PWA37_004871 [Arxiozyma heterogenica]|uniref:glutamyl-tRNA(Gln) amidotransferase subunit HER2 n=1 Tax=Arxiozyma heterogenica TaxID=278026 RepID=UPI002F17B1AA
MNKAQLINNIFLSIKNNNEQSLLKKGSQILTYSLKDNICVSDTNENTTCNSFMLSNYKSPFNATIYEILSKQTNLKYIGKTRLDEFAMGSMGINDPLKLNLNDVLNPLFPDCVPGGSSSGAAASVSSNMVDFAIGTDTGGSIRLPAAWCSTMGFKPSYGKISRYGVIDMAQSLDTVGILSNDINIIKYIFRLLDKYDPKDTTSLPEKFRSKSGQDPKMNTREWKIGIPKEIFIDLCDPEVWSHFKIILANLFKSVPQVSLYPVSIPSWKLSLPIYYTLCPSEVASNMARYDGIRYGSRESDDFETQNQGGDTENDIILFASSRSKHLGKEVKRRIVLGNYTLSSDSYKNNYMKAQKLRMRLIDEFNTIFRLPNILLSNQEYENDEKDGVDFLLVPTNLTKPPKLVDILNNKNQGKENPIMDYINDFFTVPMSLAGLPTISIPMCKKSSLGLQIVGQYGDDYNLLDFSKHIIINSDVLITI